MGSNVKKLYALLLRGTIGYSGKETTGCWRDTVCLIGFFWGGYDHDTWSLDTYRTHSSVTGGGIMLQRDFLSVNIGIVSRNVFQYCEERRPIIYRDEHGERDFLR